MKLSFISIRLASFLFRDSSVDSFATSIPAAIFPFSSKHSPSGIRRLRVYPMEIKIAVHRKQRGFLGGGKLIFASAISRPQIASSDRLSFAFAKSPRPRSSKIARAHTRRLISIRLKAKAQSILRRFSFGRYRHACIAIRVIAVIKDGFAVAAAGELSAGAIVSARG